MFAALKTYFYLQKPRKAKENDENTNKTNKKLWNNSWKHQ